MEVKLEQLVEILKREGVDAAKKDADELIDQAKKNAAAILERAKKDAARIVEEANLSADNLRKNGEASLKQASRDTVLVLKEKIGALFDTVFKRKIEAAFTPEVLKDIIVKIPERWITDKAVEVLVNPDEVKRIQEMVFAGMREELKGNLVIRGDSKVTKGFRIGLKEDNVYYDFTDEGVFEALKEFLSPTLREILEKE